MSDRGNFRGGGRGNRGDHRGGRGGGAGRGGAQASAEKPKKDNILDLTKYMDKEITVKFNGGREGQSFVSRTLEQEMATLTNSVGISGRNSKGVRPAYESGAGRCPRNVER